MVVTSPSRKTTKYSMRVQLRITGEIIFPQVEINSKRMAVHCNVSPSQMGDTVLNRVSEHMYWYLEK